MITVQRLRLILILLVFGLVLPVIPVQASMWDDDLLNELDVEMDKAQEQTDQEDESFGSQLKNNLDLHVRLRSFAYLKNAPQGVLEKDTKNTQGEARLLFATRAKGERFGLTLSGWLEAGTTEDTYDGVVQFGTDNSRYRRYFEIDKLYLTSDVGSSSELHLGKMVLRNGISTLYSPADRYSGFDLNDPLDHRRLGRYQAEYDIYDGDTSYTLAVQPVFTPPKLPSSTSRWTGNTYDQLPSYTATSEDLAMLEEILYYFRELTTVDIREWVMEILGYDALAVKNLNVQMELPGAGESGKWGMFGRVKTTVKDWDLFASAFRGPGLYPVLRVKETASAVEFIGEFPIVDNFAGGFSTTWKDLEFHGELLLNLTEQGKDDDYLGYVFGFTYDANALAEYMDIHRVALTVEYAGEEILRTMSHDDYYVSTKYIRFGRNDLLWRLAFDFTEDISLAYMADMWLDETAALHVVRGSWRLSDGLVWDAGLELFSGPSTTYYGRWKDNDRLTTSLTYSF